RADSQRFTVMFYDYSLFRYRQNRVKQLIEDRSVNRFRSLNQAAWIDHMSRASRMDDEFCIRTFLHEQTCAAGMIEMNVSNDDIFDYIERYVKRFKPFTELRNARAGTRFEERNLFVTNDIRACPFLISHINAVNKKNPVAEIDRFRFSQIRFPPFFRKPVISSL